MAEGSAGNGHPRWGWEPGRGLLYSLGLSTEYSVLFHGPHVLGLEQVLDLALALLGGRLGDAGVEQFLVGRLADAAEHPDRLRERVGAPRRLGVHEPAQQVRQRRLLGRLVVRQQVVHLAVLADLDHLGPQAVEADAAAPVLAED